MMTSPSARVIIATLSLKTIYIYIYSALQTSQICNINDIISKIQSNKYLNSICDYPGFFDTQTTLGNYENYCSSFGYYEGQI